MLNQQTLSFYTISNRFCYSVETRQQGVTVVVDAQRSSWRLVRPVTRQVSQVLGSSLATLLVLRPDAFWDKQRVDNCARVHKDGEVLTPFAYCCKINEFKCFIVVVMSRERSIKLRSSYWWKHGERDTQLLLPKTIYRSLLLLTF